MIDAPIRRVAVVGSSGSGKTTFAARLAARLGVEHIELDAINWGPDWSPSDPDAFRDAVSVATSTDGWVCDGNYSAVRPIVLERADTVVWLDLPLRTCLVRVIRRTRRRIRGGEELWAGNRETWRQLFIGQNALFWWLVTTHRRRRRDYAARFASSEHGRLRVFRFGSSAEADDWLTSMSVTSGT